MRPILSLLCLPVLAGCVETTMPEPDEGAAFFAANCTSCHGATGRGDGPLASGLSPRPVDLSVLAQANGGTFPTARALSYIYGDPTQSHLARVMPGFGGALAQDEVPLDVEGVLTPTPRSLVALLAYMETLQR